MKKTMINRLTDKMENRMKKHSVWKRTSAAIAISTLALFGAGTAVFAEAVDAEQVQTELIEQTEEMAGMINPVKEVTEQEMIEETGIDLPAPEGAEDVRYTVIETKDKIAQMTFTLDGHAFTLRACSTGITKLFAADDKDTDEEDASDISGLYYEWDNGSHALLNEGQDHEMDVFTFVNSQEGAGYAVWVDAAPGILYNLCMTEDADSDLLTEYAQKVFVPMQGEV